MHRACRLDKAQRALGKDLLQQAGGTGLKLRSGYFDVDIAETPRTSERNHSGRMAWPRPVPRPTASALGGAEPQDVQCACAERTLASEHTGPDWCAAGSVDDVIFHLR